MKLFPVFSIDFVYLHGESETKDIRICDVGSLYATVAA